MCVENRHGVCVAVLLRDFERGGATTGGGGEARVGATHEQDVQNRRVAAKRRKVHRRAAIVRPCVGVELGVLREQELHNGAVAIPCGVVQRLPPARASGACELRRARRAREQLAHRDNVACRCELEKRHHCGRVNGA